jgi:hypothetical protein
MGRDHQLTRAKPVQLVLDRDQRAGVADRSDRLDPMVVRPAQRRVEPRLGLLDLLVDVARQARSADSVISLAYGTDSHPPA